MYIKKLDLMFFLVNNFSEWNFIDTNFVLDSNNNNMLLTKVQGNSGIFATIEVYFNYNIQMITSEINYF